MNKRAVKAAAAALKRGEASRWELARLTWENTRRRGGPSGDKFTLDDWAAKVAKEADLPFGSWVAWLYAKIWDQYGDRTSGTGQKSWDEAYWEVRGTTPKEKRKAIRSSEAKAHAKTADIAEVAAIVTEALERPEVAREVVANSQNNAALAKASLEHMKEVAATAEAKPGRKEARQATQEAKLDAWLASVTAEGLNWPQRIDWQGSVHTLEEADRAKMAIDGVILALTFDKEMEELTR